MSGNNKEGTRKAPARSPYGASERAALEQLADQLVASNAATWNILGRTIADKLRTALPDMDDVTIGRVLVAVGRELQPLFPPASCALQWAGLTAAGLQLTESEWKDAP